MDKIEGPEFLFVRSIWPKNRSEKISIKELYVLFRNSNISVNKNEIEEKFVEIDYNGDGFLEFAEVVKFVFDMSYRREIKSLFEILSDGIDSITPEKLQKFLIINQGEDITLRETSNLIKNYYRRTLKYRTSTKKEIGFYIEQFEKFMNGSLNSIMKYVRKPKMIHPLSCYYISSSHNTYLKKHQLVGESSIMMYKEALQGGCKCIEVDCWDDGDYPVIYHGYTLTSKILFKDVIAVIAKYAFVRSPYPVIISIENHCSTKNQDKMAFYLSKYLHGHIALQSEYNNTRLPSPEQLKYKLVVKCKIDKNTSDHLKDLIFLRGVKEMKPGNDFNIVSKSESYIKTLKTPDETEAFRKYTETNLVRIYPAGSRIQSSNYDPIKSWKIGAQLVALNWQTKKLYMRVNESFFEREMNIGYRLKPNHILHGDDYRNNSVVKMKITLYSGRFLPKTSLKGIINPQVKFSIIGIDEDTTSKESIVIKGNGLCPFWNETFSFSLLHFDDDFLNIEVFNGNELICYYIIKLEDIRAGFHNIPLKSDTKYNYNIKPNLFCKVKFE